MSNPFPLSAALGDSGAPVVFTVGEKSYTMGHPTQVSKDYYCKGILDAEKRKYERLVEKGLWTLGKADERLEHLGGQIERGEHEPGGPLFAQYSQGADKATGVMLFVWSLLAEKNPGLTLADVRKLNADDPAAVKFAIRKVVPRFFEWALTIQGFPSDKIKEFLEAVVKEMEKLLPPTPTSPPSPDGTSSSPPSPTAGHPPESPG